MRPVPPFIQSSRSRLSFCRYVDPEVVKLQSRKNLILLLPLLQHTTGETLYLILETLRAILALDKELLTPESTQEVAKQLYDTWLAYSNGKCCSKVGEADDQIPFSPLLPRSYSKRSPPRPIPRSLVVLCSRSLRCWPKQSRCRSVMTRFISLVKQFNSRIACCEVEMGQSRGSL